MLKRVYKVIVRTETGKDIAFTEQYNAEDAVKHVKDMFPHSRVTSVTEYEPGKWIIACKADKEYV